MRTDDELANASKAITYEIRMLHDTAGLLASGVLGDGGALRNAVLESFTIHARVLYDLFFGSRSKHDDDVFAGDFFAHPADWHKVRTERPELQVFKDRVGKEVAHLTYARIPGDSPGKEWNFVAICDALEAVFQQFIHHADRSKLTEPLQSVALGQNSIGSLMVGPVANASTYLSP